MDEVRIAESRTEREIRAFVAGFEERTIEIRGYGLADEERAEIEAEARELYAPVPEPVLVGTVAA